MPLIKFTSPQRWFLSFLCLILLLNGAGFVFVFFSAQMSGWQLVGVFGGPIVGVMLCLGGAYHFSRQIAAPLKEITTWLKEGGSRNPQIETLSAYEEIRQLASHSLSLLHKVQRTTVFMEEVGKGNLQVELENKGEKGDALAQALLSTRNRLLENQEAGRQRSWSAEGITQLEELLRKHNSRLDMLAEIVIQFLVNYLKANQGALFLVQEDENKTYLDMASCYAYARKKFMEKRLQPGEGLVGQVYLEKAPIYLTELPQGYTTITSGLGEATPTALILVPLQVEEKMVGVLEVASFSTFEEHQQHFLNKAAQSIASSVMNVQVNMQTSRLLEQSQQQTEELRAQEEEMRQNMEELEATQEEMQRVTAEMQGQLSAINHTMATIAFSPDGTILEANENFLQLMGYRLQEIQGRHHRLFVREQERESESYRLFWQQLARGENKNGEFSRMTKSGAEVYIRGIYHPIFNQQGKVEKVLKLAYDITETKRVELEMNGQLSAINQTMATISFSPDGYILEANENFLKLMGYGEEEIKGRHHRMFVEAGEAEGIAYTQFWEALAKGENNAGDFSRINKAGQEVRIRGIYNPIKDKSGKVQKVLKLAYALESVQA